MREVVTLWFIFWLAREFEKAWKGAKAKTEAWARRKEARRNAAIDDGCRLRAMFAGMSDEEQQKWAAEAELFKDYRFKSPTLVPLWDQRATWGVCVPGKHDEAKIIDVTVRHEDGATAAKQVGVMFAACHELDDKRRWVSVCMIIE